MIIGYLVAIVATVVIMIIFNHGQPALLYLVPGCLLSVVELGMWRGEMKEVWKHSEEEYMTGEKKEN